MSEERLADITEALVLWRDHGRAEEFSPELAGELVREIAYMRRQREHDVHLLRRCRDELIRVNDQYQELLARAEAWAEQERDERDLSALLVQDDAGEEAQ